MSGGKSKISENHKKLGQLEATAICGNDISSSVLYVSVMVIAFAGRSLQHTVLIRDGTIFGIENILLKVKHRKLPRPVIAS